VAEAPDLSRPAGDGIGSSASLYPKLSPGPGRSASEVAAHQRARIYGAMIEIVAEKGYGAVTVRKLAQAAGVSTHTFYERFDDKEECFLSTCEFVIRRGVHRVLASQNDEGDWQEQLRLTFRGLTRELAREPKGARLVLVDAFAAGPAAHERMRRAGAALETMAREGFADAPDGIEVPPLVVKGIVAGVARLACARLLEGREQELPSLADELMSWALCFRSEAASAVGRLERRPGLAPSRAGISAGGEADGLDRQAFGDERALILMATTKLAISDGYGQLSVPGIRAAAGVSRKSVDTHFEDVTDCFLAAHESLIRRAVAQAVRQGATADTWPAGLHRALGAFCTYLARDQALARLGFIEVFASGIPGIRLRARLIATVADRLRRSAPPPQRPSELAAEASVGAALGIIHHFIATGRAGQLPRAAPTLSFLMLAPAIGARAAADAIVAEHERTFDADRMAIPPRAL
jgi:AcrR family transcriptional regulator